MTIHPKNTALTRRNFVAGSAGLTFAFAVPGFIGIMPDSVAAATDAAGKTIGGWIAIGADGTITIAAPAAEMGQGIFTSLPMIIAEELDADWSKVKATFPPPNHKVFGNPGFGGIMHTVASRSVSGYWDVIRMQGAQARRVLMQAAAGKWGVPLAEVSTEPSTVVHQASGRRMSYGEIAGFATVPAELPKLTPADLKKPADYRIIGKEIARLDIPQKVNGTARYGMDVQVPGMLYATLLRAPVEGASPDKVDAAALLKIRGVRHTITLKDAVAVVGETVESVFKARDALKVTWKGGATAGYDSEKALNDYAARAKKLDEKGLAYKPQGDADAALAKAAKVISAEYQSDYTYHAQMEPMNITARLNEAGEGAEIWMGIQGPTILVGAAARALNSTPDKIRFHQHFLGGGFGRRADPDMVPYVLAIAKVAKKPIKLIWSREQDVKAAKMRPQTAHFLQAGLDAEGNIVAWKHRLVGEAVTGYTAPPRLAAAKGLDPLTLEGAEHLYEIGNKSVEYLREIRGAALAAWRGIGSGYNKFVIESFIDELAAAQNADPVAFRLKLLSKQERARRIIEETAKMAAWGRKPDAGRAFGFAYADVWGTQTAAVVEISLDRASGKLRVHQVWTAVDPGIVINPNTVVAQTESNVIYGLSQVLKERITLAQGAVEQSNFSDYEVLRQSEVPEIITKVSATDNRPTGIGEIALPLMGGAVGNALYALTGKRLRHMPFTQDRVKKALA